MKRIYIRDSDEELLQAVNNALNRNFIEYDIDDGGRYMIDDDNIEKAIKIMESVGAEIDII